MCPDSYLPGELPGRPLAVGKARRGRRSAARAFTIIEAVISLAALALTGMASTVALNLFDDRAAHNRNTEAARAQVDDLINYLLNDGTNAPAATAAGTDLDHDGIPDGVVCTVIDTRSIPNATLHNGVIPLVVTRTTSPKSVVFGTLYWRVQAVGTAYGLNASTDLMQVNFMLVYVYRGRTYYYKALTFKAST
jgi:hypothetical protein